jgi:hypothetical protein
MNERGEFITAIVILVIAVGLLVGGFLFTLDVKCDPKVQHCIDYGSGSVEAPK